MEPIRKALSNLRGEKSPANPESVLSWGHYPPAPHPTHDVTAQVGKAAGAWLSENCLCFGLIYYN